MTPTLSYEQFKAAVTNEYLRLLTMAAHKQKVRPATTAEADGVKTSLTTLLQYRLLDIGREEFVWEGDDANPVLVRQFDCVINPLAVAYMTQLTMDGLAKIRGQ